jgi:integrase
MSSRPQYLFKRSGSDNYYLRLQPPGRKVIERSLGTPDLKLAEIAAMPLIREHKTFMYQRRPTVTPFWDRAYEPGLRVIDGEQVIATDRELQYLDASGNVIRREPNGTPAELLRPAPSSGVPSFRAYDEAKRVAPPAKDGDDQLLENYLKHNGVTGYREREARQIWHVFKTVVGKPIAKCRHKDGVAIVDHLIKQAGGEDKIKRATLRRRMVPLVATVNLAIEHGELGGLEINPFGGVVGKAHGEDSDKRQRFTEDDMALMRANLHKLDKNDELLVRVLATTGIRRGEAFEISNEQIEDGIRFCVVGTKTPQSRRQIPFPADLLPYLPEKITGQLIPGRLDSASKRLREWLTEIGITDPAKAPMHSFRHRAKRRLINAGVPRELINAVGGWADTLKKNSGDEYGTDEDNDVFAITTVKEAIDKIGF